MSEYYLEHDTTEEDLSAQLPPWMPKDPESGNYQLLSTLAERIDAIKDDIAEVDRASNVQTAETIDQLDKLARLMNLRPYGDETKEHFRARVIAEYQLVTCEGTVHDIISSAATILATNNRAIGYTEEHTSLAAHVRLSLPGQKLDEAQLTDSEIIDILGRLIPAGYTLDAIVRGTFTYRSVADYQAGVNDPDRGYDGLDANGNPKGNGGTYAGLLE